MVDYQKLYAYLVTEVDNTIQDIANHLVNGQHGWEELNAVGVRLRDALLAAEEIVLNDTQD